MESIQNTNFLEGHVLLVNKPLTWTSFDVVNKIRYALKSIYGKIKVGHAGTLDPLATGLLIICTGKATKQIDQYMGLPKQYRATIQLGATTPSYDAETAVDQTYPTEQIDQALIQETLNSFVGDIQQIPPVYSAIRINGRKAYEQARKGVEEDMKKKERMVHIESIKFISYEGQALTIDVDCSKGTYIRSLAYDIGKQMESGGHLIGLERTSIGEHQLGDAWDLEKLIADINAKSPKD